jgi:hypothetical protein
MRHPPPTSPIVCPGLRKQQDVALPLVVPLGMARSTPGARINDYTPT